MGGLDHDNFKDVRFLQLSLVGADLRFVYCYNKEQEGRQFVIQNRETFDIVILRDHKHLKGFSIRVKQKKNQYGSDFWAIAIYGKHEVVTTETSTYVLNKQ